MAQFVAWLDAAEPLTRAQVARQARLDDDVAEALGDYIDTVVIPAARQLAEERSGSAIRKARFIDTRERAPWRGLALDKGQAYAIESITLGDHLLDPSTYRLAAIDKDRILLPVSGRWDGEGDMVITYLAGVDVEQYPSVVQWMLLASSWMLEQPSMYSVGQAIQAMPPAYVDGLLSPITVPPRV